MARGPRGERWEVAISTVPDPGRPQLRADCIPGDDDMDPVGRDPLRGRAVRRRNGGRRWCAMGDCGTHEKIRRYVTKRAQGRSIGRAPR